MQRAIDSQLFDWPSVDPRLIGSECKACGTVSFPRQRSCPKCCGSDIAPKRLSKTGRLWTWTTQEFPPKPPYALSGTAFAPFTLGYVELPGEVIVEAPLAAAAHGALSIGMPMQLQFRPLYVDDQGIEVISFAFAPAQEAA